MDRLTENKLVLITRRTRLDDLISRFNTIDQAKFYVEHLGADFSQISAGLLGALQNGFHLRFLFRRQRVLGQQFSVALDDGQRCFQLVGKLDDLLPLPLLHGPLLL